MWTLFFTVFSSVILFVYYLYHPNYFEIFFTNSQFWTVVFGLGICGSLVWGWQKHLKNYFIVRRISIIGLFALTAWLLGNIFYFSLNLYEVSNWFVANFFMLRDLAVVGIEYFLIVIGGYLYGNCLQTRLCQGKYSKVTNFSFFLNIALGISLQIGFLWLLGLFSMLNQWTSIIILVLPFTAGYKHFLAEFKDYCLAEIKPKLNPLGVVAFTVLLFIVGTNFWEVYRPIPIGWDDMGVYINIPNLLAQKGALMTGFQAYNWGLLESIGFTVFGADTFALFISLLGGFLAMGGLFSFLRKYSNDSIALLVITLFYSSPAIVFQSSKDMKVDLALFFFSVMIFWLITKWSKAKENNYYLILAGILTGVAFGIKYTVFLFFIAMIVMIAYHLFAIWGALAGIALGNFMAAWLKLLKYGGITVSSSFYKNWQLLSLGLFGVILTLLLIKELKQQKQFWLKLKSFFLYPLLTVLFFSPWMIYNYHSVYGFDLSWKKITNVGALTNGQYTAPRLDYKKLSSFDYNKEEVFADSEQGEMFLQNSNIPKALITDGSVKQSIVLENVEFTPFSAVQAEDLKEGLKRQASTGGQEELGRYVGYEDNFLQRYLTLPWKVTINKVVQGQYVDITAVWFIFGIGAVGFITWRLVARKEEEDKSHLLMMTLSFGIVYLFLWIFIGSGIFWYGIAGFTALLFLINHFLTKNSKKFHLKNENVYLYLGGCLLVIALLGGYVKGVQQDVVNTSAIYALQETGGKETRLSEEKLGSFLDDLVLGTLLDFKKVEGNIKWIEQSVWQGKKVAFPTVVFNQGAYMLMILILLAVVSFNKRYKEQGILILLSVILISNCLYRLQVKPHPNFLAFAFGGLTIEESITGKAGVDCKKFATCNVTEQKIEGLFPGYLQASKVLNEAITNWVVSNDAPIYRVGTFIRYFLQENNEILVEDSLIDKFNYLSSDGDHDKTFARLKKLGINFMIIDMFTPTIDKTPEKTLTRKFKNLIAFVEAKVKEGKIKIHVQNKRHGLLLVELLD